MQALADVQDAFARALLDPARAAPAALVASGGARSDGFDVYRNNRVVSLIDALAATYPGVQRLVGEAFFRATARIYVDRDPPRCPILHRYGAGFGEFLDRFPPAAAVPYLGDVARLEWSVLRAYHAPDAEPLHLQALAAVPPQAAPRVRLGLHPSLALHRSRWPIGTLWSVLRRPDGEREPDMARAEDVLVVRPALEVQVRALPDGARTFVGALAAGATIEQAAARGAGACNRFDLVTQLQGVFAVGAVVAIHPPQENAR